MYQKEKNEFLNQAFNNNQANIVLADSKANIFITVQSLLITIGIAGALISDTFIKIKEDVAIFWGFTYVILLIGYIITSLIGIITAINVFRPRGPKEKKEEMRMGIFYFGHISKYANSLDYRNAVEKIDVKAVCDEFCNQIYQIAKIAEEKMLFVKKGASFLYINVIFTIIMLIYTILIHLIW